MSNQLGDAAFFMFANYITWQVREGILSQEQALRFVDSLATSGKEHPGTLDLVEFLRTGILQIGEEAEREEQLQH
jgi:polyhydroxyalkanoate synthesis regulator phasin